MTEVKKIMDTKLFHTDDNEIAEAGEILRNGGLVAFPTETVYGLGAIRTQLRKFTPQRADRPIIRL